jgi:hypothetical protein
MTAPRPAQRPTPPRQAIALARRPAGPFGTKAIGSLVPGIARKAFQKYGFSAATLLTDWAAIAGRELAQYAAPERLKWPRCERGEDDEAGEAPRDKRRAGATLVLRVDGARALDVEYKSRQIVERINSYFGYPAIAELRIVQAPVVAPFAPRPPRPSPAPLWSEVAGVAEEPLRNALARLGAEVRAAR